MEMERRTEFFECKCFSDEHLIKVVLDYDTINGINYPELSFHIFLYNYQGFFKRCWVALKYILGYKSKYGDWDTFLMSSTDAAKLQKIIFQYFDLEKNIRENK